MYTMVRVLPWRELLAGQLPVLLTAWVIAEAFYKFKSFTLECAAFLVTWFVLDFVLQALRRALTPPPPAPPASDG